MPRRAYRRHSALRVRRCRNLDDLAVRFHRRDETSARSICGRGNRQDPSAIRIGVLMRSYRARMPADFSPASSHKGRFGLQVVGFGESTLRLRTTLARRSTFSIRAAHCGVGVVQIGAQSRKAGALRAEAIHGLRDSVRVR